MTLENICAIETLLQRGAGTRAETANHRALVVRQGVAVLVVLAGKALDVVIAGGDRTLLWTFQLMGEHVCLDILEYLAAIGEWARILGER